MSKLIRALLSHPLVEDVSIETHGARSMEAGSDGYWIYLVPGWRCIYSGTHCVHEWTVKDSLRAFREIEPCDCIECKRAKEKS